MAEEIKKEEKDEILEDIETSLVKKVESGCLITIHPNGLVEIATGELARQSARVNLNYSCCCCCG